ncbi:MAG: hypothetical protein NWR83_09645 [Salibacteraceae bacterium]|nr:hypothetical protein [Salibacteraceae bacterium]
MRNIGAIFLMYVGATVRWMFGTIWRTLANKNKFTYKEYVDGPEGSNDWFDSKGHHFVNLLIGIATLVSLVILSTKL